MESAKKTNIAGSKAKSRSVEKTSEEKKSGPSGEKSRKQSRKSGDRTASATKGVSMRASPRKGARVNYSEVDYNEFNFEEVQASGMVQGEGEAIVTIKDIVRRAEVYKSGAMEKENKTKDGKEKQGKDLKRGKRRASVGSKVKGGAKTKEENNNENVKEGLIGGEIIQEGVKSEDCGKKAEKLGEMLQEKNSQAQVKKVYSGALSIPLKRKIAEKAVEVKNCTEVARQFSKELGPISAFQVRSIKKQVQLWDMTGKGGNMKGAKSQEDEDEAGTQQEGDGADVGVGLSQGEKGTKEKETLEEPEISMVLDTHSKYEETPLSAGCMKIRVLEMKWREIKTKEKLLELEKEEIAQELQAEKEKLKPLLEESLNPKASD